MRAGQLIGGERIMRLLKLGISCLAFASVGCATRIEPAEVYTLPEAAVARVVNSQAGALVIDHRYLSGCDQVVIQLLNIDTGETISASSRRIETAYNGPAPQIFIVQPGQYMFKNAGCQSTRYDYSNGYATYYKTIRSEFPVVALWLEPMRVAAGRITYPGTVFDEQIAHEYGVALLLRETLSGRTTRSIERYPLYEVRDQRVDITAFLQAFNPVLSERLDVDIQPTRLDKAEVRAVVDRAFEEEAGTIPPDDATARANRDAALKRIDDFVWNDALRRMTEKYGKPPEGFTRHAV
jgi:hypothetical protein